MKLSSNQQQMLNGRWIQTYYNEDGVDLTMDDLSANTIASFQDGKFQVCTYDDKIILEGVYKIHDEAVPAEIDWSDTSGKDIGKTFLAIYELTQDRFMFSASDEGIARPVCFTPKPGHTIRKFRRLE